MKKKYKIRRSIAAIIVAIVAAIGVVSADYFYEPAASEASVVAGAEVASEALNALPVKGRAPKTNYSRAQFGNGWETQNGCDTRNIILHRDLINVQRNDKCQVTNGTLHDPYTGNAIDFERGESTSQAVQIDHVVALSDAWQKGAQQLPYEQRVALANDPLELLAVDGGENQKKSDSDAASWLPPNKAFRCMYVSRQIAVKKKYNLWVTAAEKTTMAQVLDRCPGQTLPLAR